MSNEHPPRADNTYVADLRTALCAGFHIGSQTFPFWLTEVAAIVAEDARLRHNALPVADGILLDAVVGHFAGSDVGVVLFAGGGQVNDVGGGDESADGEEALVL
jgi:hypothetical protein